MKNQPNTCGTSTGNLNNRAYDKAADKHYLDTYTGETSCTTREYPPK